MEQNKDLQIAWDFVEHTGVSIFLTGKAGTGKTTFLKAVRQRAAKRMVVLAPTGVAAINAGGMTIHSFFQLPLTPYVPETSFKQRFNFSKEKRKMIRTLDLLVIDEISMVRSDLLDAVDSVMRRFRDPRRPFGGVQLLMIGDLQQLTPVVTADEEPILGKYYETPYFFSSKALQKTPYVTLELKHIYRQQDTQFINILNHIRDGKPTPTDLALLNSRCQPLFRPTPDEEFIRLTTHNRMADSYNDDELRKLPGPSFRFDAHIEGDFPQYAYPTDLTLTLKQGAQVMFVKNDPSPDHLFYNGRIGRITTISENAICVHCQGDENDIRVEPLEWENTKYELNEKPREIESRVEGTFRQYPLRLAWAITIHKSQGLTFDKAIIDASLSFSAGQVYVALSRCKTLEGLVLASAIRQQTIFNDARVVSYITHQEEAAQRSIDSLPQLKEQFHREQLRELFDFSDLQRKHDALVRQLAEHFYNTYPRLVTAHKEATKDFRTKVGDVAAKWNTVIMTASGEQLSAKPFVERISRGAIYFLNSLSDILGKLLEMTDVETDNKAVAKRMDEVMADLLLAYRIKVNLLQQVARESFSMDNYLQLKQHAVLEAMDLDEPRKSPRTKRQKKEKSIEKINVETSDILHPELFSQLRRWRMMKAQQQGGLPAYTVLSQKALIGMVNHLPTDMRALLAIPYFGKKGAEKYGDEILRIIRHYVSENQPQSQARQDTTDSQ